MPRLSLQSRKKIQVILIATCVLLVAIINPITILLSSSRPWLGKEVERLIFSPSFGLGRGAPGRGRRKQIRHTFTGLWETLKKLPDNRNRA
jgi:hypothetical protein